jgi:hypothetical protein
MFCCSVRDGSGINWYGQQPVGYTIVVQLYGYSRGVWCTGCYYASYCVQGSICLHRLLNKASSQGGLKHPLNMLLLQDLPAAFLHCTVQLQDVKPCPFVSWQTGFTVTKGRGLCAYLVAASTAIPAPVAPPPMISTSNGFCCCRYGLDAARRCTCCCLEGISADNCTSGASPGLLPCSKMPPPAPKPSTPSHGAILLLSMRRLHPRKYRPARKSCKQKQQKRPDRLQRRQASMQSTGQCLQKPCEVLFPASTACDSRTLAC